MVTSSSIRDGGCSRPWKPSTASSSLAGRPPISFRRQRGTARFVLVSTSKKAPTDTARDLDQTACAEKRQNGLSLIPRIEPWTGAHRKSSGWSSIPADEEAPHDCAVHVRRSLAICHCCAGVGRREQSAGGILCTRKLFHLPRRGTSRSQPISACAAVSHLAPEIRRRWPSRGSCRRHCRW